MEIAAEQTVSYAAERVFKTVRDRQAELVNYMPNIEKCEVIERKEAPPEVKLLNRWQATMDELPAILRPIVSPELLSWLDHATWNEETLSCRWKLEAIRAKEILSCSGTTTISQQGQGCLFSVRGDLTVDANKIPGIPRLLAGRVRKPLERLISGSIRPNLTGIAEAVQKYLDQNKPVG